MRGGIWLGLVVGAFVLGSCTSSRELDAVSEITTAPELEVGDDGVGPDLLINYNCGTPFTSDIIANLQAYNGTEIADLAGQAGVTFGLPEVWSELPTESPSLRVFVDLSPLTEVRIPETVRAEVYRVQAYKNGEVVFNGACLPDGAEIADPQYVVTEISSCSVTDPLSPTGGHTLEWHGSEGTGGTVQILRNGETQVVFAPGEPDVATALERRQIELGEIAAYAAQELFGSGAIIHADFEPPVGIPLTYELISLNPEGDRVSSSTCGTVIVPTEYPPSTCTVVADPFPVVAIELGAGFLIPMFLRNGEEIARPQPTFNGPAADLSAPVGIPLTYEIVMRDRNSEEIQRLTCGTVTVNADVDLADRLRSISDSIPPGPYWYSTVNRICDDCDAAVEVTMYWESRETSFAIRKIWLNRDENQLTGAVWETPPTDVPALLLSSLEQGRDVSVKFSEDNASISQWSIDGQGVQVLCERVDTAPLEMHNDTFCRGFEG